MMSPLHEKIHRLESYDYYLPKDRIAQRPLSPRDSSRLLLILRRQSTFSDHRFRELSDLLEPEDLLVLNNTKVIPARLQSDRGEVLLIRPTDGECWDAMVFPGKHFKPATTVTFAPSLQATVLSQSPVGRILQFHGDVHSYLQKYGKMPLPPYIEREADGSDVHSYQTIYARKLGSVAAPTAGFHFTHRVFQSLQNRDIEVARLTLHVGPGTFKPVKSTDITQHSIYPEYYSCSESVWRKIQKAKRTIAVGTTTTRALETIARTAQLEGYTDLFIYPGFKFQTVSGLITNFHLPKSSLLMLVSAFGGYDLIRNAYEHAVNHDYRFYSYGDAMLIL
jgi:S-adenosylmethionine:tRNA ribosyltransferase-isomerase